MNPWVIRNGLYWRSRAEILRRTAEETDTFRPETRARMLRVAKNYDVLATRAEERLGGDNSTDSAASPTIRRRGRPRSAASG
jgi:hypothetical protein